MPVPAAPTLYIALKHILLCAFCPAVLAITPPQSFLAGRFLAPLTLPRILDRQSSNLSPPRSCALSKHHAGIQEASQGTYSLSCLPSAGADCPQQELSKVRFCPACIRPTQTRCPVVYNDSSETRGPLTTRHEPLLLCSWQPLLLQPCCYAPCIWNTTWWMLILHCCYSSRRAYHQASHLSRLRTSIPGLWTSR